MIQPVVNAQISDLMTLEDKIAAIIKEEYAGTGFEDEGRSDGAAHAIVSLIAETIRIATLE